MRRPTHILGELKTSVRDLTLKALKAYTQMSLIKVHADVSSEVRGLTLPLSPYTREQQGSGESAHMRRLA